MANFTYHNKWHGFNHHTQPSDGFPDSAIDPIASLEYPFKGIFYNRFPLSASETGQIIYTASDSFNWEFYTTLTQENSADWGLWPSVSQTASGNLLYELIFDKSSYRYERWSNGYDGYIFWKGLSSTMVDAYNISTAVSGEEIWPLSTEGRFPPVSGLGWHIALSSITWKTNVSAINNKQKNFGPPLALTPNQDGTLFWDVSTGQTAFLTLTQDRVLTATRLFNVNKGGKYTMWVAVDYCPLPEMNLHFSPDTYRIEVVKYPRIKSLITNTEVISLSPNNITKIDFVFDGRLMLGKATHYKIFLPTTDDLYFEGLGNRLATNPYYVNGLFEPSSHIRGGPGLIIRETFNNFTDVSAIYVAGSGVNISYFGQGTNFFNFSLIGPAWLTESTLNATTSLTSSFDRVYGNLKSWDIEGGYQFSEFASDLFGTPSEITAPNIMKESYPTPYKFTKFNLVPVPTCLSSLKIDFRTAKDRDIKRIVVNRSDASLNPPVLESGRLQRYNFTNERQVQLEFERIQTNNRFSVYFERQAPIKGLTPIIWFDPMDQYTTSHDNNCLVGSISSKPNSDFFLTQSNQNLRPLLCQTDVLRSAFFTISTNKVSHMAVTPLLSQALKKQDSLNNSIKDFTVFTVVEPVSVVAGREFPIWWLGDFDDQRGFGLVLSGNKICYGGVYNSEIKRVNANWKYSSLIDHPIEEHKPFLITNLMTGGTQNKRSTVYLNGRRLGVQRGMDQSFLLNISSYNLNFGAVVDRGTTIYGAFKLHSFILYDTGLSVSKISAINKYLMDKFYINEGYGSQECESC
jgi:hypothetical protein